MRGVSFHSKESIDDKDFIKIFNNINLDGYKIKVGYQELYKNIDCSEMEINEDISWGEFIELANTENFYTIFLEMFIYKKNDYMKFFRKIMTNT